MQGPIAARMPSGRAPSSIIASMVASHTPPTAPRQPAWQAPITPSSGDENSTGAQSAVMTPSATFGRAVTKASASCRTSGSDPSSTTTTLAEWTWWLVNSADDGRSRAAIARARLASTAAWLSPLPRPQFSEV